MTAAQAAAAATAVQQIANSLKAAKVRAAEFSTYNGVTDPGWGTITNGNAPTLVGTDGFIIGTTIAPGDVSNAIGSINVFLAYYNGQAVTTSAWGNNLEKISNPIV